MCMRASGSVIRLFSSLLTASLLLPCSKQFRKHAEVGIEKSFSASFLLDSQVAFNIILLMSSFFRF